jgi:predicted RNA-binding protein associated with RNAse of E/G family
MAHASRRHRCSASWPVPAVGSTAETVRIRYRRPPDREDVFIQRLVQRTPDCVVTLMRHTPLAAPLHVGGRVILEDGAPVVWFTFPGAWHDIGRFHTAAGTFTGLYANILTPVRFLSAGEWETTDLFLDLWRDADGGVHVLDADELAAARAGAWIDAAAADAARREADRLVAAARAGAWPPSIVGAWPLERALAAAAGTPGAPPV